MNRREWMQYEEDCIKMLRIKREEEILHILHARQRPDWLEESGFLDAMENLGKERRFHDFGFDAIGRHPESGRFAFFQFKARKKVDGADLSTFLEAVWTLLRIRGAGSFDAVVVSTVEVNPTSRICQESMGIQHVVYPMQSAPMLHEEVHTPVPRNDQLEALRALQLGNSGGIYAPCGWGKTLVMALHCRFCVESGKTVVVVAKTQVLCRQLAVDLAGIIGAAAVRCMTSDDERFVLAEAVRCTSTVMVVTYQTYRDLAIHRDVVLFDEAHHVQVAHLQGGQSNVQHVLFTATPRTLEGIQPLYVKHWNDAAEEGIILKPRLIRMVPDTAAAGRGTLADLAVFLRDRAVFDGSDRMVVFANRVNDVHHLARELRSLHWDDRVVCVTVVEGNLSQTKRDQAISDLDNACTREVHILLSVDVLSEGINMVKCNSVVLMDPSSTVTVRDIQRVSRCIRPDPANPGKSPVVYVFQNDGVVPPIIQEMGRCFPRMMRGRSQKSRTEGVGPAAGETTTLTGIEESVLKSMERIGGDFRVFNWEDTAVPDNLVDLRYVERVGPGLYRLLLNPHRHRTFLLTQCGKDIEQITKALGPGGDGIWGTSKQNAKMIQPDTWMVFCWHGMARKVGVVVELIAADEEMAKQAWGEDKAKYKNMYRVELVRDVVPRSLDGWNAKQMQGYWSKPMTSAEKEWLEDEHDPEIRAPKRHRTK